MKKLSLILISAILLVITNLAIDAQEDEPQSIFVVTKITVMTPDGGPDNSTATMVWFAIRRGWGNGEIGFASAVSVVFVAIVLAISLLQRMIVRSESALD